MPNNVDHVQNSVLSFYLSHIFKNIYEILLILVILLNNFYEKWWHLLSATDISYEVLFLFTPFYGISTVTLFQPTPNWISISGVGQRKGVRDVPSVPLICIPSHLPSPLAWNALLKGGEYALSGHSMRATIRNHTVQQRLNSRSF